MLQPLPPRPATCLISTHSVSSDFKKASPVADCSSSRNRPCSLLDLARDSGLQNAERIHVDCSEPPNCGHSFQGAQGTDGSLASHARPASHREASVQGHPVRQAQSRDGDRVWPPAPLLKPCTPRATSLLTAGAGLGQTGFGEQVTPVLNEAAGCALE